MEFYTSVCRVGNNICYRGYEDGVPVKKKIHFTPTLYYSPSPPNTGWQTLEGHSVMPRTFDNMSDATGWLKANEHVSNAEVHGTSNFAAQYIYEKFPNDIDFDRELVKVASIDIEVASDDGFPEPDKAEKEVISIALKNNYSKEYLVWALGDYDTSKCELPGVEVIYVKCDNEIDLLTKFLSYWSGRDTCPDIVTGWNTRLFDIPYLINRVSRIIGQDSAKKFSPWGMVREKQFGMNGRTMQAYEIVGIEQLDYYDLFQKFGVYSYGVQESYKLDHIANVVLGEKKLSYEEHGNLFTLYKEDFQKFIDYNIKDTQLIERLEDKMGLITLAMTMGYKAGVNYSEAFGTTQLWDTYIYRELSRRNIAVPPKRENIKAELAGGYVKAPMIGRHSWVVSFDLNSLYPHLMLQYNMSPETILDRRTANVNVRNCLEQSRPDPVVPESAMAANGVHFRNDRKGVIPVVIDSLYGERSQIKKEMLNTAQEIENEGSNYALEKKVTTLDTQQMAIKIMMNSLYGAMGNRWFRYYDIRVAEAITMSGQLSILWAEKAVNNHMNKILGTQEVDYVIAIDTDSVYVNFGPLIESIKWRESQGTVDKVQFLDKVCRESFEPLLEKSYQDLSDYMGAYENRMVMKREGISDAGIWTAKKRYILNVHNNEGVQYDKPKLKIMGIEAVKSSTPSSCRTALKELFKVMITGTERDTQQAIQSFKTHFKKLPAHEIAFPRGASRVAEWKSNTMVYKKGCPIHVRGALIYNKALVDLSLDKRYNVIKDGEKVKFLYLKLPNPMKENIIAFMDYLPEEFKLQSYIDYDTQFDKAFLAVVRPVLEAIGWREEDSVSLEDFFG